MQCCPDKLQVTKPESFKNILPCNDKSFSVNREIDKNVTTYKSVDFYVIGKLWIDALSTALVGENVKIATVIPVVDASTPAKEEPKKPGLVKYKELPIYDSPHYDYKQYEEDKTKCPDANVKLLHRFLLPYVAHYRKQIVKTAHEYKCLVKKETNSLLDTLNKSKNDFKDTMRDPDKLPFRYSVVSLGGVAGYIIGSGGGIPRRALFTGLGLLSTGALCFPQETDENFKNFISIIGNTVIILYNKISGDNIQLRGRMACKEDLPPPVPPREISCPRNKK